VSAAGVQFLKPGNAPGFDHPCRSPGWESAARFRLTGDWVYEIKFDGYRALALRGGNETRVLSRNEKDLGGKFPEVQGSIAALDVQDAIIDYAACGVMQSIFRSAPRCETLGRHSKGGRRGGELKIDWTKPLPRA
jgi:hypothetical protein